MSHPKLQHYVPRFLLSAFTRGERSSLFVFDKTSGRVFETGPEKVAAVSKFYDVPATQGSGSFEPALAKLESRASAVVAKIRKSETLQDLTAMDRGFLALFIAVQHLRTAQFRAGIKHTDDAIRTRLESMGADPSKIENYRPFSDDDEVQAFSIMMLKNMAPELARHIVAKQWILLKNNAVVPFIIGDHPVALHNDRDFGLRGNLGFAVPGIEIYLPLSDSLSLLASCTSNIAQIQHGVRRARLRRWLPGKIGAQARLALANTAAFMSAIDQRMALTSVVANVEFHNSLQTVNAERWLFSATNNFDLPRTMIEQNPELRHGPRSRLA